MRRWLMLGLLPFTLYGLVIAWTYRTPPLAGNGLTTGLATKERGPLIGYELENGGRWPLTLRDAHMGPAEASAWVSLGGGWLAGNMAVIMETDPQFHPHRREPVEGFILQPDCDCPLYLYAVRFDLPAGTGPGTYPLTIRYRYLGWTFTYRDEITLTERETTPLDP